MAISPRRRMRTPLDTVRDWAAAWSRQDTEEYVSFYASTFRPASGLSGSQWLAQRRQRLTAPAFIEVTVSDLEVVSAGVREVRVRFHQTYRSDTFSDRVVKTLVLLSEAGDWRIYSETTE